MSPRTLKKPPRYPLTYIYIQIYELTRSETELRDDAKKMVAKGKTYGKRKGRDLASVFLDLSISPSKPGTYVHGRGGGEGPELLKLFLQYGFSWFWLGGWLSER